MYRCWWRVVPDSDAGDAFSGVSPAAPSCPNSAGCAPQFQPHTGVSPPAATPRLNHTVPLNPIKFVCSLLIIFPLLRAGIRGDVLHVSAALLSAVLSRFHRGVECERIQSVAIRMSRLRRKGGKRRKRRCDV